ncbi:chemotaxis protein CheW [Ottowia sp.]|uniref:chemotaxis protein CheW n=1 Tax=Ottowia sp. TaxID=1898956 RepID=UPI002CBD285B|nr:chemotaxis protein CheW [Ottowia sp.]HOB65233.1 chemotaxis protein CheW [Ottowia sp.]HPZ56205.1 chemotaxis protein CheW [Ottowia sp.]HQD48278.1 chemotaxis protein CheW [Ottowia sp.]
MATKQALREFQTRLAERLQSARTTGVTASWLAVEARTARLLFPLSHAGEIFSWTDVQRVPYVQPWFMGVANLRGALSAVIDLAAFMGVAGADRARNDGESSQCRLVALNPMLEANCALLVDRLLGLRTPDSFTSSAPADAAAPSYFSHRYTDAEGRQWQELNLQALSQHPSFLGIGA